MKIAAFAAALAVHAVWLALLAWVRPGTMTLPPAPPEFPFPAVELSLVPRGGGVANLRGSVAAGGAPSALAGQAGLRRLDSRAGAANPAQAASPSIAAPSPPGLGLRGATAPAETALPAPTPPSVQTPSLTAAPRPAPSTLEAPRTIAAAPSEPEPETLAARPQVDTINPVTAAARRLPPSQLRSAQGLALPEPEPETLAARAQAPQAAAVARAARPIMSEGLRAAQGLTVAEPEPEALAARAEAPQQAAVARAARPNQPQALRPAQGLVIEGPPETLAARPQAPQAPAVAAAGRAAAPRELRPAQGLAPAPGAGEAAPPALAAGASGGPAAPGRQAQSGAGSAAGQAPAGQAPGQGRTGQARNGQGPAGQGSAGSGQAFAGAPGGQGAGPHPGCDPEVLMLLTPEERVRCRNQLDAANQRRANQTADENAARRVQLARSAPWLDGIEADKRAYYDAVVASREAVRNQIGGGKLPGLACNLGALLGGGGGPPGDKIKIPGLPCVFQPPVGTLTEETRLTPP